MSSLRQAERVALAVGALVVGDDPAAQVGQLGPAQQPGADLRDACASAPTRRRSSGPGLVSTRSEMPILPTSCSSPASRSARRAGRRSPCCVRHQARVARHRARVLRRCRCRGCRAPRPGRPPWPAASRLLSARRWRASRRATSTRSAVNTTRAVAAHLLGGVQRLVGGAHARRGRRPRAPGKVAMPKQMSAARCRRRTPRWMPSRTRSATCQRLVVRRRGQQQRELLAADAGGHVGPALPLAPARAATRRSASSPAWWPRRSFTSLKPSRSPTSDAQRLAVAAPRAPAPPRSAPRTRAG